MNLTEQKCIACEGGVAPLIKEEVDLLIKEVEGYEVSKDGDSIEKHYAFADFKEALDFVDKVGAIAEQEGHHPDIHLTDYKNVSVVLSTHAIGGLSHNDFIVAAKVNALSAISS